MNRSMALSSCAIRQGTLSAKENCPACSSVNYVQRNVIESVLKARELAEICGRDVVVDVAEIPVVGEIEDSYRPAEFVVLCPGNPAHAKVFGKLQVERKISWETKAVGRSNVVLENVNSGIREACVKVDHGAGGNVPRNLEPAPGHETVGNIARQSRKVIRPDNRLFEGHEDGGERVQVSASEAANIRHVDVGILTDLEAQGGFQFLISG